LRERFAVAVRDLPRAVCWNIQDVSTREFFAFQNVGTIVSSSVCGGVVVIGTADGASAWANNAVDVAWIKKRDPQTAQSSPE